MSSQLYNCKIKFQLLQIISLKNEPSIGLPIIEALKTDADKYVQTSLGNWLNDAAKTKSAWVNNLLLQWKHDKLVNPRIIKLASRSLLVDYALLPA